MSVLEYVAVAALFVIAYGMYLLFCWKVYKRSGDAKALRFTTDFPLKEGNNNVLVVARENPDFSNRRTLIIRRRPSALAQKLAAEARPAPQQGSGTPQKH